jgi:hypothetical protein
LKNQRAKDEYEKLGQIKKSIKDLLEEENKN